MKDKNKIEIRCDYCKNRIFPTICNHCKDGSDFSPDEDAYQARIAELEELVSALKQKLTKKEQERRHESSLLNKRIAELQTELNVIQESERAEAQEADRLRAEVKELGKKLSETIKLLSERSRECGKLEAHNEVLRRRVQEFSMELLEQNMRDNKDVLERLKNWEEYLDKDMSTQSTDADDVSKKIRETDMSNIWWR